MSIFQEPSYVGVDVATDQVEDALRPTGISWSMQYEEAGVEDLLT